MRPLVRLGLGGAFICAWMFSISPKLHDQLLQRRSLRSNTISAPTLKAALHRGDQSGEMGFIGPEERARIDADVLAVEALLQTEGILIQAIWAKLPKADRGQALEVLQSQQVPPPQPDPRFVDPYTPILIMALLKHHGYRRITLVIPTDNPTSLSYRDQILVAKMLVEDDKLDGDLAGQILDAAMQLDAAQRERVEREREQRKVNSPSEEGARAFDWVVVLFQSDLE